MIQWFRRKWYEHAANMKYAQTGRRYTPEMLGYKKLSCARCKKEINAARFVVIGVCKKCRPKVI